MYILLACGSGASSGFLAQNIRKAAKKKGVEVTVKAVSDTQIEDYLKEIDILLIGPHLKHRFVEIESMVAPHGVIAMLVNQDSYAVLDGEAVLNEVLSHNK